MSSDLVPVSPVGAGRRAGWALALVVALVCACLASLAVGTHTLSPAEVVRVLLWPDGSDAALIVHGGRLPRTVLGVLAGAALGAAGALVQGHTRNGLADPGLLGVTEGASFGAVVGMSVFGLTSPVGYVWFAFAGAAVASVVVFAIATVPGRGPTPLGLVLAGAAMSALLLSVTTAIVVRDLTTLDEFRFWAVGSLSGRGWSLAWVAGPFIVAGLVVALAQAPALNTLSLGDDVARSLGLRVGLTKVVGLAAVMLLCGAATAVCGPIVFLGLVVPHLVRAVMGPDQRWVVPASAVAGAGLLVAADVLGRVIARPGELQVGIVLALVGGPFFIAVVRRRKLVSL